MKIITWNINGYRSAQKIKALDNLIAEYNPDIVCLQEIKMNTSISNEYGYNAYYNFAQKQGYSGTLILTKEKPIKEVYKMNLERFDDEGRFILLEYPNFVLINIYIPHGGRRKENHPYKFASIDRLIKIVKSLDKKVIICTDFNIAHTEKDVKNYKTNYHNNMFSPEERAKIDELLSLGFLDSFRVISEENNIYSMWPNGFDARKRNMGWRIDYIFISKEFKDNIKNVSYLDKQMGSDHCPCLLELS